MTDLIDILGAVLTQAWNQVNVVLHFPVMPTTRIYYLFLISALMFALFVFSRSETTRSVKSSRFLPEFLRFLFPASVWKDSSAWLDVRYFFFHSIIWVFAFGTIISAVRVWTAENSLSLLTSPAYDGPLWITQNLFLGGIIYMFVLMILADLTAYAIHYLQHKVPLLWEFHKVHHSATVMHPLTNFREHPIDNLIYFVVGGFVTGILAGVSIYIFGGIFSPPKILGMNLLAFAFNFLAYNLRHSHIWVRWPGKLIYVFGCPAHHQVHHSCHPDHIDKNFAFMLPVWDVIFGTFCLPETNKDVKFGLGAGQEADYKSVLGLYFVPFKKIWLKHKQITI